VLSRSLSRRPGHNSTNGDPPSWPVWRCPGPEPLRAPPAVRAPAVRGWAGRASAHVGGGGTRALCPCRGCRASGRPAVTLGTCARIVVVRSVPAPGSSRPVGRICGGWSTAGTTPPGWPCRHRPSLSLVKTFPETGLSGGGPWPRRQPPPATTGIGHTRWATHGGPTDVNAHPHLPGRAASRHPQRDHRNFAALKGRTARRRGVVPPARPTPRWRRISLARAIAMTGELTAGDADGGSRRAGGGVHPCWRYTPTYPDTIVGARRNSPSARRGRPGEELSSAPTVAAFIGRPRQAVRTGPGPGGHHHPDQGGDHRVRRERGDRETLRGGLGRRCRREGWIPQLHGQGASTNNRMLWRYPAGAYRHRRPVGPGRLRIDETELRAVNKIVVVACGTAALRRHVARYAVEHWCRILVRGGTGPRGPLPGPGG
jgi:hypothetical protein